VVNWFARWVIYRIFKGLTIDKFLRQSGIAFMVDSSGRLRATRLVAETVYWCILLSGVLAGVNVFGTEFTTQMIQGFVLLLPKLVVATLILVAGAWLGQYLGRSMLVWAVNENFPYPRRLAVVVRILIMFAAVVVAADQLNFDRSVFLASFIIFVGGAVLVRPASRSALGAEAFGDSWKRRGSRPGNLMNGPCGAICDLISGRIGQWRTGRSQSPIRVRTASFQPEGPGRSVTRPLGTLIFSSAACGDRMITGEATTFRKAASFNPSPRPMVRKGAFPCSNSAESVSTA
jgi:hypothetical protein